MTESRERAAPWSSLSGTAGSWICRIAARKTKPSGSPADTDLAARVTALFCATPKPSGVIPEHWPSQVTRTVRLVDARLARYDPRWPHLYRQEIVDVAAALAPVVAAEHVGSTSVP